MPKLIRRILDHLVGRRQRPDRSNAAGDDRTVTSPREDLANLVARLQAAIDSSEQAFAEAANTARSAEARLQTARDAVDEWDQKARQAETRHRAAVAAGKTDDRRLAALDDLVQDAVHRSVRAERLVAELEPVVEARKAQLQALRRDLASLYGTRDDLQDRRSELIARSSLAEAESQVATVLADLAAGSPTSELSRIEADVREREAAAVGRSAVAALADPDKAFSDEFDALIDAHTTDNRIEDIRKEL